MAMICKECGHENRRPIYWDMQPEMTPAIISDEPFEPEPFGIFWDCAACHRIHWKNGELYMSKARAIPSSCP